MFSLTQIYTDFFDWITGLTRLKKMLDTDLHGFTLFKSHLSVLSVSSVAKNSVAKVFY